MNMVDEGKKPDANSRDGTEKDGAEGSLRPYVYLYALTTMPAAVM